MTDADDANYMRVSAVLTDAIKTRTEKPKALYLGQSEFASLCAICKNFGHPWPIAGQRPKMHDVPIFVVDAAEHLAVL